jgi:hypothetical protein
VSTGGPIESPFEQTACPGTFAGQVLLTTREPPWADAVAQALAGNTTCEPAAVTSVESRTTQHADALQVPLLPAGSWIATFRSGPEVTPAGRAAVHCETSSVAGVAEAKHRTTSKHSGAGTVPSGSTPASEPPAPGFLMTMPPSGPMTVVGVTAAGTHPPCTHVCPAGHIPAPASPASAGAMHA